MGVYAWSTQKLVEVNSTKYHRSHLLRKETEWRQEAGPSVSVDGSSLPEQNLHYQNIKDTLVCLLSIYKQEKSHQNN